MFSPHLSSISSQAMVPEMDMEKPRVTEIRVRMDCNGCVQKIKKALHGITGISDLYIDFPQQKVTIIGWADPAKIVKAIKKTRKSAVICTHPQQADEAAEPESEDGVKVQAEEVPPAEGAEKDTEEVPPSSPEANSSHKSANETSQSTQHSKPQNIEEIHVVHHHSPDYRHHPPPPQGNGGQWNAYLNGLQIRGEPFQPPQPIHVTHSYNTYKVSPHITEYAFPSQPPPADSHYEMPEQYTKDVHYSRNSGSTYGQWNAYSGGPKIRGEPSQLTQPIHHYSVHNSNGGQWNANPSGPNIRGEPSQPPHPIHHYSGSNGGGQLNAHPSGPHIRGEPSQPPQPIHHYSGSNSGGQWNAHPSGPQIRGEAPQSPHPIHYYSGNDSNSNSRQWTSSPSGPQIRGEPCQPTQPTLHASHSYNTYKPLPYATEYAYLQSPQGYSHYSTPDNYNQVYYSGNGNITSMFSEENPNACSIV